MRKFPIPMLALICSLALWGTGQTVKAANADGILNVGLPDAATLSTVVKPSASLVDRPSAAPIAEPAVAPVDRPLDVDAAASAQSLVAAIVPLPPTRADMTPALPADQEPRRADESVELSFAPPPVTRPAPSAAALPTPAALPTEVTSPQSEALSVAIAAQPLPANPDALFDGGADSIVARTVGHAEGTRTADGQKTSAYYGHVDPGNAHWNIGSFSYQHCDKTCTPEVADDRQLARLRRQTAVIQQRAAANNITLTLEEALNGIDLANQAPLAALDQGGYIDHLKFAHQQGQTGADAVLYARTWAFRNPQTQTWDAPGLGNRYESISHDQERRLSAIAKALNQITQQSAKLASSPQFSLNL